MPSPTHIGFLQFDVCDNPATNLQTLEQSLAAAAIPQGTLLTLPELWHAGFNYETLDSQVSETDSILRQLQHLCQEYQLILAGSLPTEQENGIINTLYIVNQSGVMASFAKQHLFEQRLA